MNLDQLIEEGEFVRDTAMTHVEMPGMQVDMEKLSEFATKAVIFMERNARDMSVVESVRENSKGINKNNAYDRLLTLLGILKGYKSFAKEDANV